MFEHDEVLQDLHNRLVAAGINPLDPKVQAICEVVNVFYAEKTREVLEKMQAVLSKIPTYGGRPPRRRRADCARRRVAPETCPP